jgi:hypothetical protein
VAVATVVSSLALDMDMSFSVGRQPGSQTSGAVQCTARSRSYNTTNQCFGSGIQIHIDPHSIRQMDPEVVNSANTVMMGKMKPERRQITYKENLITIK